MPTKDSTDLSGLIDQLYAACRDYARMIEDREVEIERLKIRCIDLQIELGRVNTFIRAGLSGAGGHNGHNCKLCETKRPAMHGKTGATE